MNVRELIFLGDWGLPRLVFLCLLFAVAIGFSFWKTSNLRLPRRLTLIVVRAVAFALGFFLLLEPAIETRTIEKQTKQVGVLVDRSGSMGTRLSSGKTRLRALEDSIEQLQDFAETRREDYRLHFYSFAEDLERLNPQNPSQLTADGKTHYSHAIEAFTEQFDAEDLGGIVLLSDGLRTAGPEAVVHRLIQKSGAPLNSVFTDDPELQDLSIENVSTGRFAFVKNKTKITAQLKAENLAAQKVDVKLKDRNGLVDSKRINIKPNKTNRRVQFSWTPEKVGKKYFKISVTELDDEATYRNNEKYVSLEVIRDQIRVLQVAGTPSWDQRFLRRFLKKNANIDLVSFFILRTRDDLQIASTDELSLIPFPTRELFEEKLHTFDLVIFQNFNFAPYQMERYLSSVAKFVENGGGFAMLGGDRSFSRGGYRNTPIEELLPGEVPRQKSETTNLDKFHPTLTQTGRNHPITKHFGNRVQGENPLAKLPKLHGVNRFEKMRSKAEHLVNHPEIETLDGNPMPVISVMEPGDGRTMAINTDSIWRFGFEIVGGGGTPRQYQTFWNRSIRWLIGDPAFRDLKLETSDNIFRKGEVVELDIAINQNLFKDSNSFTGEVEIRKTGDFFPERGDSISQEKTFGLESNPSTRMNFSNLPLGFFELQGRAQSRGATLENSTTLLVSPDNREYRRITPNPELLKEMSTLSDGNFIDESDFNPSKLRLKSPEVIQTKASQIDPIWHHPLAFIVLFLAIGIDWLLHFWWTGEN